MAITLKQIKARVRYGLGLWGNEGFERMPEDLLEHLVNEAQTKILIDLKLALDVTKVNLTANQRSYQLPEDFLEMDEVRIGADDSIEFRGFLVKLKESKNLEDIERWRR